MDYYADSSAHHGPPPMSCSEIATRATDFDWEPLIPLRYWLRTANTLVKESQIYLAEGNDQQAYLLLLRFAELILKRLPSHPEAHVHENPKNLRRLESRVALALKQLEALRPRIDARYREYFEAQQRKEARRTSVSTHASPSLRNDRRMPTVPTNRGYELEFARQEFEKREREKREQWRAQGRGVPVDSTGREIQRISTPRASMELSRPSSQSAQYAPPIGGYIGYETDEYTGSSTGTGPRREERRERDDEDLSRSIQALHMHPSLSSPQHARKPSLEVAHLRHEPSSPKDRDKHEQRTGTWGYNYPNVRKPVPVPYLPLPPPSPSFDGTTPIPPPKKPYTAAPLLPEKPPYSPTLPTPLSKSMPNSPAKDQFHFSTPASLENGAPLRTIFLPASIRYQFLRMAAPNTSRNIETCGILCGSLMQNALFISRLVIPEQDATSDTCTTKDEEGLFEYCDKEDLIVLGWIHTHPSQTCFMSSVDLHTQASYQLMLPESIAIVCAPSREPSYGVFRLTDPPGLQTITQCRQSSLFHPHHIDNIYTDATRPGHVKEVKDMGFDVVDLRKR